MRPGGRCQAPVDSECLLTSTLDSFQNERSLPLRGAPEILSQHASAAYKRVVSVRVAKAGIVARSPLLASRRCLETPGIESPQEKGDSPMLSASSDRDLDQLGDEITELSAHLDAATARLLDLVSEFDGRGGWSNGFRSCAAWLSWRVGFAPGAAREHVRVAHALGSLPLLSQAFARGELSYSKVRELTRVATSETEERLLAVGRAGTAEHVERIVRWWRRMDRKAETQEATRRHRHRALHVYQDADGMVVIRGRLEPEVGAVVMQALAAARDLLYRRRRA